MPNQSAAQDDNQVFALIAHSGTAGTSDTIRVVADSAGNLGVNIAGTEPIELVAGTITRVSTIGTLELGSVVINGTPIVSNLGTNVNVVTGTINVGTTTITNPTGTVIAIGSQLPSGTNILGSVNVVNPTGTTVTVDHGTITLSDIGTNINVITGTQQALGTLGTLQNL